MRIISDPPKPEDNSRYNRRMHDDILARAIEVLEDEHKATHWLTTPNRALDGVVPMTLLDTPEGKEEVLTILGRIEYGVYS